jgi:hypothetical protein
MGKVQILQLIAELPEDTDVDVEVLSERLHLLNQIEQAEKQLRSGEGNPHDQVRERLG